MSRWIDSFKGHGFWAVWQRLKEAADAASIEDTTLAAQVGELARLKKAVHYIDGIVTGLDPELAPMSIWDTVRDQVTPCVDQVVAFNATKNIGHIQQANQYVDNLLSYVRPYMLGKGAAGKALQDAAAAYAETMEGLATRLSGDGTRLLAEIASERQKSADHLNELERVVSDVGSKHAALVGSDGAGGSFAEIELKHREIAAYQTQLSVGSDVELSIKQQVAQAKEEVTKNRDVIVSLLNKTDSAIKDLEKFHTRILGSKSESGEFQGGLASELDARVEELSTFEALQKTRYSALNSQIESLLPGATSAGLASAYKELKDSFEKPIRSASTVFYVSIAALVVFSFLLSIQSVSWQSISFVPMDDWRGMLRALANRIPFYGPILWLAFYATKRRSEFQRLQQEYAHKEALAKSYDSYKKQVKELDTEDSAMLKDLILKSVDAIAHNASKTLDGRHGDKMPSQEILEKLAAAVFVEAKKRGLDTGI